MEQAEGKQTIYVVDDDELTRESICALAVPMGVRAESFSSAEEFLAGYDGTSRGCVVTDLRMVGINGVQLQESMAERGIQLPVILVTGHPNTAFTVRAIRNGAVTVLEKPCDDQELWDAIGEGLRSDEENCRRDARRREFLDRLGELTPEERQVMDLIVAGHPNKSIARQQEVSERTVETRRQRVFRKMGADSLADLVRRVVQFEKM